ncbi:MAG: VOC family protein [Planctomycetota bacterium]
MAGKVNPIPQGFHTITPHLVVRHGVEAITFYKRAFGAEELTRMTGPDGESIMHAELRIGDSVLLVCDECPEMGARSPQSIGGTPVTLHLYVENVDRAYARAVEAGATAAMPPQDQFWGDRYARVTDPFGHHWSIATHIEDVTPQQCVERAAKLFGGGCGGK